MIINPFVLGAIRDRENRAAWRRQMLRMDIAGNTPYLNPQLNSAWIAGTMPQAPVSPLVMTPAGLPMVTAPATLVDPRIIAAGVGINPLTPDMEYFGALELMNRMQNERTALQQAADQVQRADAAVQAASEQAQQAMAENVSASELLKALYPELIPLPDPVQTPQPEPEAVLVQ